jgi:hypothetical protein
MGFVNVFETLACPTNKQKPKVRELSCKGTGYIPQVTKGPEMRHKEI